MKQKYKKMKKTFRLFSMTMFVLLMTVCFSACSSDDDGEPNGSPAKKISRFVDTDDTINFAYDSAGRVISVTYSDSEGSEKITYKYEASKIVAQNNSMGMVETYILDNGLISEYIQSYGSQIADKRYYFYDAENRLRRITHDNGYGSTETQTVEWDDENIVSIEGSTYTYSDIPATKGLNWYHNIDWALYSQGYFGKCSKNLFSSETRYEITYEYKFDLKDGYVIKASCNDGSEYTLDWE